MEDLNLDLTDVKDVSVMESRIRTFLAGGSTSTQDTNDRSTTRKASSAKMLQAAVRQNRPSQSHPVGVVKRSKPTRAINAVSASECSQCGNSGHNITDCRELYSFGRSARTRKRKPLKSAPSASSSGSRAAGLAEHPRRRGGDNDDAVDSAITPDRNSRISKVKKARTTTLPLR